GMPVSDGSCRNSSLISVAVSSLAFPKMLDFLAIQAIAFVFFALYEGIELPRELNHLADCLIICTFHSNHAGSMRIDEGRIVIAGRASCEDIILIAPYGAKNLL